MQQEPGRRHPDGGVLRKAERRGWWELACSLGALGTMAGAHSRGGNRGSRVHPDWRGTRRLGGCVEGAAWRVALGRSTAVRPCEVTVLLGAS